MLFPRELFFFDINSACSLSTKPVVQNLRSVAGWWAQDYQREHMHNLIACTIAAKVLGFFGIRSARFLSHSVQDAPYHCLTAADPPPRAWEG